MKIKDITLGIVLGIVIILIILTSCIAVIRVFGLEWLLGKYDTTKMTVEQLLATRVFESNTVTYLVSLIAVLLVSLGVAAITSGEKQFKKFSSETNESIKASSDDFLSKAKSIEKLFNEFKINVDDRITNFSAETEKSIKASAEENFKEISSKTNVFLSQAESIEKLFNEFKINADDRITNFSAETEKSIKASAEENFKEISSKTNVFLSQAESIEKQVNTNKQLIDELKKQQNLSLRNAIHETIIFEYINIIYTILILPELSQENPKDITPELLVRYNYQIGRFVDKINGYMEVNSVQSFECKMQKKALELISEIIENFKMLNNETRNSQISNQLIDLRKRIKNLKDV